MTRTLVVLRPQPGARDTVAAAEAFGLAAIAAPLFTIEPLDWVLRSPAGFTEIVAGSANAFRHGGPQLAQLTHLPVHAVGERTAAAARAAGFAVARTGTGGLQDLLDRLPADAKVLRLGGEERVPLAIPPGITLEERVVYRAAPVPLSGEGAGALRGGGIALLHSAQAAARLRAECERLGIDRGTVALVALGPRIAQAAGEGWRLVASADRPADDRLLALATRLCQY